MHRTDESKFLLFIEPNKDEKLITPVNDELTSVMEYALSKAKKGASNYSNTESEPTFGEGVSFRGVHYTSCELLKK